MRSDPTFTSSTSGASAAMIEMASRRPRVARRLQRTSSMHTSRAFLVLCSVGAALALAAPGCTGSTPGGGGNPGGGNPGGGNPGGGNPGGGNPDGGPGGGNPDGGPGGGGTDGGSV